MVSAGIKPDCLLVSGGQMNFMVCMTIRICLPAQLAAA